MVDNGFTNSENGVTTKLSSLSVEESVALFIEIVKGRGMQLFAIIDHSAQARDVGLELRETTLVIFGNAVSGTPIMVASPLASLDLPLKVIIWSDQGQTKVSYYTPSTLAVRHNLSLSLAGSLAGIDALTDALVAS